MQGLAAVEAMAASDSLRCDEVMVVVLLSVIVATFVLCDEFFLLVFARIMSKPEPDRGCPKIATLNRMQRCNGTHRKGPKS
jgi:hypothetical protein